MEQQIHQFCKILATPPDNPIHHVVFSPGYKDRIKFARAARRGHPQRYWLEQMVEWIYQHSTHILTKPPRNTEEISWDLSNTSSYTPSLAYNWRLRRRARLICSKDTLPLDAHGNRKIKPKA